MRSNKNVKYSFKKQLKSTSNLLEELYFHCILTSVSEASVIYCIFESPCSKHSNDKRDKRFIEISEE